MNILPVMIGQSVLGELSGAIGAFAFGKEQEKLCEGSV